MNEVKEKDNKETIKEETKVSGRCKKICPTQAIRCGFAGKDQT